MNTNVTGNQSTVTETRLKIVPDEKSLRFELQNSGDVRSQTTGFNAQATVDSIGQHHFEITKPLWFDGSQFLTLPAHGTIQASQTPQRVFSTAGASMPLLGPLTDRVAWNEVLRRTPQINQAVAEDVSRDVLPKINRVIDEEFAKQQDEWNQFRDSIDAAFGALPLRWAARSTRDSVSVWATDNRILSKSKSPALPRTAELRAGEAVAVFVSEHAIESLLAEHFPAGLTLSDKQLQKLQAMNEQVEGDADWSMSRLMSVVAAIRNSASEESGLFTLELAPRRPLQVKFADGEVQVITTFQIHPKGAAPSGWMTTTFNLRGKKLSDDEWTIAIRSVDVDEEGDSESLVEEATADEAEPLIIPAAGDDSEPSAIENADVTTVQAGTVWLPIIRGAAQSLAEKIPPVKLPIEFNGADIVPGAPRLRLAKIDATNAMLRISLKVVKAGDVAGKLVPVRGNE